MNPLSCVSCRQRKVKCNRIFPCSHCVRAGIECVFPSRKRSRKPRLSRQNELLLRLSKLEEIVGRVDPASLGTLPAVDETSVAAAHEAGIPAAAPEQPQDDDEEAPQEPASRVSRPKDDPSTKYMSAEFWSNLCGEVHGLKQALEQPSDSEDEGEETFDESSPEAQNQNHPYCVDTSPAVLGTETPNDPELERHPKPTQIRKLCDIYFQNIDYVLKILHRPSIIGQFDAFLSAGADHAVGKETEALFFAIYFAAVTSLTPEECKAQLGEERSVLVRRFKRATEAALVRADYLNSNEIAPLQAFLLYVVSCLPVVCFLWAFLMAVGNFTQP